MCPVRTSSSGECAIGPEILKNVTFDEIKVGDTASLVHVVGRDDIALFAAVSGDVNPAHMDPKYAATDTFGHIVAHGMWTGALVSAVLGFCDMVADCRVGAAPGRRALSLSNGIVM